MQGFDDIRDILKAVEGMRDEDARKKREEWIAEYEKSRPLPNQALIGTAINEATKISMENDSRWVVFDENLYPKLT